MEIQKLQDGSALIPVQPQDESHAARVESECRDRSVAYREDFAEDLNMAIRRAVDNTTMCTLRDSLVGIEWDLEAAEPVMFFADYEETYVRKLPLLRYLERQCEDFTDEDMEDREPRLLLAMRNAVKSVVDADAKRKREGKLPTIAGAFTKRNREGVRDERHNRRKPRLSR